MFSNPRKFRKRTEIKILYRIRTLIDIKILIKSYALPIFLFRNSLNSIVLFRVSSLTSVTTSSNLSPEMMNNNEIQNMYGIPATLSPNLCIAREGKNSIFILVKQPEHLLVVRYFLFTKWIGCLEVNSN